MESINITLRNPKAKKLLKDLEALNLITINKKAENKEAFFNLLEGMRKRVKKAPAISEITTEVEAVRKKRYGKK